MCRGSDLEQPRSRRSEPTPRTSHATNTCRENGRLNLQQYIAATSYKRVPPPPPVPQSNNLGHKVSPKVSVAVEHQRMRCHLIALPQQSHSQCVYHWSMTMM